jgi:hypothetical protein
VSPSTSIKVGIYFGSFLTNAPANLGSTQWVLVRRRDYTCRYRLIVNIEVDGKLHSGSSVIEVTWHGGPEIGDVGPYSPTMRGQAALVELISARSKLKAVEYSPERLSDRLHHSMQLCVSSL